MSGGCPTLHTWAQRQEDGALGLRKYQWGEHAIVWDDRFSICSFNASHVDDGCDRVQGREAARWGVARRRTRGFDSMSDWVIPEDDLEMLSVKDVGDIAHQHGLKLLDLLAV